MVVPGEKNGGTRDVSIEERLAQRIAKQTGNTAEEELKSAELAGMQVLAEYALTANFSLK